jgi:cysteine desulfurase family protein
MIYLDNAATSFPKPEAVYQALDQFARGHLANPGRSAYRMSVAAEQTLDDARNALNQLFGGESAKRWILTHNCTDGLNMAIKGTLEKGAHVVTSDLEHNSISRPLRQLERDGLISLTRVASQEGYIEPEQVRAALRDETRLVALTHAANALGTLQPIEKIAGEVRAHGALLLVDAAQTAGVVPIDLRSTPIDFLAFPGHKALMGPTGTGALYVGPRVDDRIRPWREGGTGGDSKHEVQPTALPYRLEGGTPNVLGVAGLLAGLRWVSERRPETSWCHEVGLLKAVVNWVEAGASDGWRVAGRWDPEAHVGALSLHVPEPDLFDPQQLTMMLDTSFDIAVRGGLHCAPYAHRSVGSFPHGTLRISPGPFTTADQIQSFLQALEAISAAVG